MFVAEDDVNTTEPPAQNVVALLAVIVGVTGVGFTITVTVSEVSEVHVPLLT